MESDGRLSIIILVVLLFLAALFAVIETAFSSVSRNKVKVKYNGGDSRAKKALFVLDNFERAITTLLICTNIVHISFAAVVTAFVTKKWGLSFITLSTIVATIVLFFAGEMLPKSIAKKNPTKLSISTAGLLCFFMKIFYPLSTLLSMLGKKVAERTHGDTEVTVTEDELYDIIEDMAEEGSINEEQEDLITSVLSFGDSDAAGIMTALKDVVVVDTEAGPEETFRIIKESSHSRLPVCEGGIGNIIGTVQIRKYIKSYLATKAYPNLKDLLDEAYYARVGTDAYDLLEILSEKKLNMAIIVNRNEKVLGIVTIEDILEEIVGDVWDESDVVPEHVELDGGDKS